MSTSSVPASRRSFSRRLLLGGGGAVVAGGALAACTADQEGPQEFPGVDPEGAPGDTDVETLIGEDVEPFWGEHQSGIATGAHAHGEFLGLDLVEGTDAAGVEALLRTITDEAARMTQGEPPSDALEGDLAHLPARLTVTVGFGPGLFDAIGRPEACPPVVREMPAFATDDLQPEWGQTDLVVQVCSDDPMTLTYTSRYLTRAASEHAELRWAQRGFLHARGSEPAGTTPRNLMGMRDGTANESDPEQVAAVLWNSGEEFDWHAGGSQLVIRRIAIDMDSWDTTPTEQKEAAFGRRISDGSPLTGEREEDVLNRVATDEDGELVIPEDSHGSRSQARSGEERMIRRAFNYQVQLPAGREEGLIFAAYMKDLSTSFVPVQQRLAESDALNTWTTHIGSAAYAMPPGATEGSFVGAGLLEA